MRGGNTAGGWFFPAVCAVCALLSGVIAASALGGGGGYSDAVNSLFVPVQSAVTELWNSAQDAAAPVRGDTLAAQNELLRERLTEMEDELARAEGLRQENAELRRMLRIRDADPELQLVYARVAAREPSGLGGVFPRGLRIGRVEAALPGDQLYTSAARIAPAVDYERMREVYVVVGFSQ